MQPFTLEEFKEYARNSSKVAVFEEIPAGNLTPITIYKRLNQNQTQEGVMLENLYNDSSCDGSRRYSYICFEPIQSFSIPYGTGTNVLEALRNFKSELQYATRHDVAHLITKAVGFFTYDIVSNFENITNQDANENSFPLCLFHFFSFTLTFDHDNQTVLISILTDVNGQLDAAYHHAREKIQNIITTLTASIPSFECLINTKSTDKATVDVDISDTDFMQMVIKAKEYIISGDAFQIVISRSFKRNYTIPPLAIYKLLREVSPAPFMFYFSMPDQTIIGASPERLVCVYQNEVTINPIAGTRQRINDQPDEIICTELLNDKKQLAEHMMLVDLARNDIGAVSKPGSVKVVDLLKVKNYSHVSHITSTVTGQLKDNCDALDALKAAIPAGTLSGAPKIRAMQIIAELEKTPRELYGGAFCRFDLSDNFDSCIAIRMAVLKDGIATVRTGAGIVFDSDPYAEAQETYHKAYGLLDAIAKAHGE